MKTGKTIVELAQEIARQATAKRDLVAPTNVMTVDPASVDGYGKSLGDVRLRVNGKHDFGVNDLAHGQIAEHVKIPKPYYDRMRREAPALLGENVRTWFEKYPARRLVRTLDGNVRAFLSDGYRPLENESLAEAILPVLADRKLEIMSCEITERRLYIKAVDERIHRDVPKGRRIGDGSHVGFDTCAPAIIISNSEVGYGRLSVDAGVFTKACTNMMMIASGGMKRTHVGARHDLTDNLEVVLSSETRKATDKAIWMQVRDVVASAFDEKRFETAVKQLAEASEDRIDGVDPVKFVELATEKFALNDGERGSVLKFLIDGGALNRYGLANAITRAAQDLDSYDRASEFEQFGGKVIDLPRSEWSATLRKAA